METYFLKFFVIEESILQEKGFINGSTEAMGSKDLRL